MKLSRKSFLLSLLTVATSAVTTGLAADFQRLEYNHPGLQVDLGVGLWAWPLPMDWDQDGDYDLVVSCPDVPYNGTYFFENTEGNVPFPVFKPGVRIGPGMKNLQVSHFNGRPHVLRANREFVRVHQGDWSETREIYPQEKIHTGGEDERFNVWSYVDFNGDGALDLAVGVDDWGDYGWDEGFDEKGRWKRGPLHGHVYIILNHGNTTKPKYGEPQRIQAGGEAIDVFGNPQPNFADFDGDGDLDLICAEFLDSFTYFENQGARENPKYAQGRRLQNGGRNVAMDLQMITPSAIDWDKDGDVDLVCGDEDGRVAFIENRGEVAEGMPLFEPPVYFEQEARYVKFGALVTPVSFDWDGDGDEDILAGNTAGSIGFIENLDSGNPPRWAAPVRLQAGGSTIRIQAGSNGSIQGPAEAKWGYTTLSVADWDQDERPDLVVNSIWGKVVWYRNIGTRTEPQLSSAQPVHVEWPAEPPKPHWVWWSPAPGTLATQWRTTPVVFDWDEDGINDLIMLDHEGYLSWFERVRFGGELTLLPGKRVFQVVEMNRQPDETQRATTMRLNDRVRGGSGRRKLHVVDWNGDGRVDILVNGRNADLLMNRSSNAPPWTFQDMGPLGQMKLAGHTTSPTTVDWGRDGSPDLLVGAEDGFLYYLKHEHAKVE